MKQYDLSINYSAQWWGAIVTAILLVAIGAIQSVGPEQLGIPAVAFRWLGVVAAMLAAVQAFLPKVQSPPVENYEEVKRAELLASDMIDDPAFPPEFVDAVADALLRKRATTEIRSHGGEGPMIHPEAPTPARQPDPRLSTPQAGTS